MAEINEVHFNEKTGEAEIEFCYEHSETGADSIWLSPDDIDELYSKLHKGDNIAKIANQLERIAKALETGIVVRR